MKTMLRTILTISLFIASAPQALAAGAVAFVTDLAGEVSVDGGSRPLLMAELAKGQRVAVRRGGALSVMYIQSGREFALKGPGDFTIGEREIVVASGTAPAARETPWRASGDVLVKVAQTQSASIRMRSLAPVKADEPSALRHSLTKLLR